MNYERKSKILGWATVAAVTATIVATIVLVVWWLSTPRVRDRCVALSDQQQGHEWRQELLRIRAETGDSMSPVESEQGQALWNALGRNPDSVLRTKPPLRPSEAAWLAEHCYLGKPR